MRTRGALALQESDDDDVGTDSLSSHSIADSIDDDGRRHRHRIATTGYSYLQSSIHY